MPENNAPGFPSGEYVLFATRKPERLPLELRELHSKEWSACLVLTGSSCEALDIVLRRGPWVGQRSVPPPRLVLLDGDLPHGGGTEVLRQLRCHPPTRLVPVVMLLDGCAEGQVQEFLHAGANSCVRTPGSSQELAEVLRAIGRYWLKLNQTVDRPLASA